MDTFTKLSFNHNLYKTLYTKPPDLGLCLELCQHCACLFYVHVYVQVRGILEVGYHLLLKYLCINSAVLHYICRSHRENALLLDMTSLR